MGVGRLPYGDRINALRYAFLGAVFAMFATGFFIMLIGMISKRR